MADVDVVFARYACRLVTGAAVFADPKLRTAVELSTGVAIDGARVVVKCARQAARTWVELGLDHGRGTTCSWCVLSDAEVDRRAVAALVARAAASADAGLRLSASMLAGCPAFTDLAMRTAAATWAVFADPRVVPERTQLMAALAAAGCDVHPFTRGELMISMAKERINRLTALHDAWLDVLIAASELRMHAAALLDAQAGLEYPPRTPSSTNSSR